MTQPGHMPSRDWLAIVKSSRSRNKIKHWLNVHQRERSIEIGRKVIEKEARKYHVAFREIKDEVLRKIASDYGLGQIDDRPATFCQKRRNFLSSGTFPGQDRVLAKRMSAAPLESRACGGQFSPSSAGSP